MPSSAAQRSFPCRGHPSASTGPRTEHRPDSSPETVLCHRIPILSMCASPRPTAPAYRISPPTTVPNGRGHSHRTPRASHSSLLTPAFPHPGYVSSTSQNPSSSLPSTPALPKTYRMISGRVPVRDARRPVLRSPTTCNLVSAGRRLKISIALARRAGSRSTCERTAVAM